MNTQKISNGLGIAIQVMCLAFFTVATYRLLTMPKFGGGDRWDDDWRKPTQPLPTFDKKHELPNKKADKKKIHLPEPKLN